MPKKKKRVASGKGASHIAKIENTSFSSVKGSLGNVLFRCFAFLSKKAISAFLGLFSRLIEKHPVAFKRDLCEPILDGDRTPCCFKSMRVPTTSKVPSHGLRALSCTSASQIFPMRSFAYTLHFPKRPKLMGSCPSAARTSDVAGSSGLP